MRLLHQLSPDSVSSVIAPAGGGLDLTLRIVAIVIVVASASFALLAIRRTQEWNRRKATFDVLLQTVTKATDSFREFASAYNLNFNVNPPSPTLESVEASLGDQASRQQFRRDLHGLLNYFETLAVGLKNHVLDEDMCYEHLSIRQVLLWEWARTFVLANRGLSPTLCIEQEHYAIRWRKRLDDEIAALRTPGKPRT